MCGFTAQVASGGAGRLEEVKRLGADGVIGKPIDFTNLIGALAAVRSTNG